MSQLSAKLQLLQQPLAAVGQRTVADQHHPIPAVQRERRAAPHQRVHHAHGQAVALQRVGRAAAHHKAGRSPCLEQPRPPGVQIHREQVQRGAGFLIGAFQVQRHIDKPRGTFGGKACPQKLRGQLGSHPPVHRSGAARTHTVAQQHLRPPGGVAKLVKGIPADRLPLGGAGRCAELRGKQRALAEGERCHRAAVRNLRQCHIPAAQTADF